MSEVSDKFVDNSSKQAVDRYNNQHDVISVRDIYMILRRGFPLIFIVSLLVAVATFLYFSLKEDVFEASATAVVSPSGLDIRNGNGISFSPQITPSFETYKSLAYSDPVIISVLESAKEQFPHLDIGVQTFKRRGDVEKIYGPLNNRPDTADRVTLAVSQKVRHVNPAVSVALTNAWTIKTIETVQETLSSSLTSIDTLTKTSFEDARNNLELSQAALQQASSVAALDVLDAQVLTAGQHVADQKVRLSEARTELEVAKQLQNTLLNQEASTLSKESRQLVEFQLQNAEAALEKAYSALQNFEKEHDLVALEARNIFLSIQLAEFEQLLVVAQASDNGVVYTGDIEDGFVLSEEMLQNALLDSAMSSEVQDTLSVESNLVSAPSSISSQNNNILPKPDRVVTEIDSLNTSMLAELRNYVSYQALTSGASYTVASLEKTINALTLELNAISSEYGPLKIEESQLRSTYELREENLSELLSERNRLATKNEALFVSLEAEVVTLEKQIELDEEALVELQAQRAEAQQTIGTLMLEVEAAADVYGEISGLEPTIAYLTELAPLSAQVVNLASQSLEPIGTGRSLPTALAFLLTAIIMTVLVFFREAIKL